ncbi:SDR family oxidoreductase [Patulibacter minatonensis]|uniref:SDR family oxidoreductase n=1 Tax=Patulibacter minatonensis TaxID=298163 RepID=UPI0004793F38|nr:SDR family oxidoreductase [Patulibacter minatonensis]
MDITGSTALITGANRGLGRHFALQLLERGATRVYATARDPSTIDVPGAEVLALDITDADSVAAAARVASDVTLLVNNAGVSRYQDLVTGDLDAIRAEMEVNAFGPLRMLRAFAPVLGANGGGAIVNVNSRMSWTSHPGAGGYGMSKAAAWSLTNSARMELAEQGTLVTGLYLSSTDTDMMAGWDVPKNDPADVVRAALDGVQRGAVEVIADDDTAVSKAELSRDPAELEVHRSF